MQIDKVLLQCINTLRSGNDMDQAIGELLEIIARFHGADRAYIFEFYEDMAFMDNTYEWCREGAEPEIDSLKKVETSIISRWLPLFEKQGEVYINSLSGELSKTSEEYKLLAALKVESLMAAPLYVEGRLIGFMGVDNPVQNTDTLLLLRSVSAFVANDIQRRETMEQKVIGAIGKTYISLHLLNIPENTRQEYQSNQQLRQLVSPEESASRQMWKTMNAMTVKEHLKDTLAFVDISTLDVRMWDTNFINHEFYSINDRWCRASFIVVNRLEDGRLDNVLFAVQLIDEEKRRELEYQQALKQALENQDEMYAEMLKMQAVGVVAYDVETKEICLINDAAREMFNFRAGEKFGGDFTDLQSRVVLENREGFIAQFKESLAEGEYFTCEYTLRNENGLVHILVNTKMITLGNGRRISLSSLTDVTEKKRLEEQLRTLSRTDALTGLDNRGYGERQIDELLSAGTSGMFCLFDVDKFKSINDSFGHITGDKALCAIADCLRRSFGGGDVIMRLGGDEFAVFAAGIETEESGGECIRRFFSELENIRIEKMKGRPLCVSLGAVLCGGERRSKFDELYQMADSAMYICKNSKGNRFGFYRPERGRSD